MKMKEETKGHVLAIMTIFIWGTTFISTKVLLKEFQPVEILFFRFLIGWAALMILSPKRMKIKEKRHEILFALAGLLGICLYFLLENIALTYTLASNVGVILSIAPFFTAIVSFFLVKNVRLHKSFFLGFLLAIIGISLISFGDSSIEIHPIGDLLALAAALLWAFYSLLVTKINSYGYETIPATKRIFSYGLVFVLVSLFFFDFHLDLARFQNPANLLNLLFLGLGASAMCFATWNYSVKVLGAVQTSLYIYLVPVITVIFSALFLGERLTLLSAGGVLLTLAGLLLPEVGKFLAKGRKNAQAD